MPSLHVAAAVILAVSLLIITVTVAYIRLVETPEAPPRPRRPRGRHRKPGLYRAYRLSEAVRDYPHPAGCMFRAVS